MATTPATAGTEPKPGRVLLAPLWHTIVLVLFMLGYAYYGRGSVAKIEGRHLASKVPLYLFMIAFELALVAYVWFLGVKPSGGSFRAVIGGKWSGARDVFRDIGIAFLFWIVVIVALLSLGLVLGKNSDGVKAAVALSPQSVPEMILWVLLAVSAGFCEEFVFRGYLQKQLLGITGSEVAAVALQALVFGTAHSYQGIKAMVSITVYGALFGILAVYRRSLRPGMLQHAMQDTTAGLMFGLLKRLGKVPALLF
ncbi:MAG: type II CAAX endopeptidase family protein [Candidatus Acidiferrales bacterium]